MIKQKKAKITLPETKRILISPLDWGLGHATRCIPIINELLQQKIEVIIAAGGKPLRLLQQEFPHLQFHRIDGYNILYSENGNMTWQMFLSIPKILSAIKNEHQTLQKIVERYKINGVISDNRYGFWSEKVPSVIITHQLFIQTPFGEKILHNLTKKYLSKFSEIWIPDFEGVINLSGDLSHGKTLPENVKYINPLSRFTKPTKLSKIYKYDLMVILSGPEPQRSIFEAEVISQLKKTTLNVLIVRGLADFKQEFLLRDNIEVLPHLDTKAMFEEINQAAIILARSGYSTIMDLAALGKKAILVPTPGQTEQEYLAEYHHRKNHFYTTAQKKLKIKEMLDEAKSHNGIQIENDRKVLQNVVKQFLGKL